MKLIEVKGKIEKLKKLREKTFPAKMEYAISCNIETLEKELERIESERVRLCEKYACKDEDGNAIMDRNIIENDEKFTYRMSDESSKSFSEEYRDLMESEVDIDFRKVKIETIERCETIERYNVPTVDEISDMLFMIEE